METPKLTIRAAAATTGAAVILAGGGFLTPAAAWFPNMQEQRSILCGWFPQAC